MPTGANLLQVPTWIMGSVEVSILGMDGRLESTREAYLGASRSNELPRFWGSRIVRIRDASGALHMQAIGPTMRLF